MSHATSPTTPGATINDCTCPDMWTPADVDACPFHAWPGLPTTDGTYAPDGKTATFRHGYQVGGGLPTIVVPAGDRDAIQAAFRTQAALASNVGAYVGLWTHDGEVHVDVSEYVPGRIDAMRLALRRRELAIWDWRRMVSFSVIGSTVVN